MKKLFAVLLATSTLSMVTLPPVFAQSAAETAAAYLATLSPEDQAALSGFDVETIAAIAGSANPAAIIAAASAFRSSILSGVPGNVVAALAALNEALTASNLSTAAQGSILNSVAASVEADVAALPSVSAIRSLANAAMNGLVQLADDLGVDSTQLASAATTVLAQSEVVTLGATDEDPAGSPVAL